MSGRRSRSQARRTGGSGMPPWAWLVLGLLLGAGALWAWTSLSGDDADFLRPRPNPDARPAAAAGEEPIVDDAPAPDTQFDFYTLLPGDGQAMTDEELAAHAEAEADGSADAGDDATAQAEPADTPPASATRGTDADDARYVLQAGAFGAEADAEAVKARIALLGLTARVEQATTGDGRALYRVRLGPYGSAAELAEAKRTLEAGGLPSLPIRAQ